MNNAKFSPSLLNGQNIAFLEDIYKQYQSDPSSVSTEWQNYFNTLPASSLTSPGSYNATSSDASLDAEMATKQVGVARLIATYRAMGHKAAKIDPINEMEPQDTSELELAYYGLSEADLDTVFSTGPLHGPDTATLREIVALLNHETAVSPIYFC